MTLEASDNRDHRGAASVEFSVQGGGSTWLDLARVYNVPNPTDQADDLLPRDQPAGRVADPGLHIERPDDPGVTQRPESIRPDEAAEEGIEWDGRDADGDPLGNGVYFYKVTVRDDEGRRESRIEKRAWTVVR